MEEPTDGDIIELIQVFNEADCKSSVWLVDEDGELRMVEEGICGGVLMRDFIKEVDRDTQRELEGKDGR